MRSDSPERTFAGAFVFFAVMALSAYTLLMTALVWWLADLLDSMPLAATIAGGLTLLLALISYFLGVRIAIAQMRERWEVMYDVMNSLQRGYRRVSGFFHRLLW